MKSLLFVKIPQYSGWARSLVQSLEELFTEATDKGFDVVTIGGHSIEEMHAQLQRLNPLDFKAVWCCHDAETEQVHRFRGRVAIQGGVSVAHNHNAIKNPYEPFFVYDKIVGYHPHASLTHLFINAKCVPAQKEVERLVNPVPVHLPDYLGRHNEIRSIDALFGARFAEDKNRFLAVKFIEAALTANPDLKFGFAFPALAKWHRDKPIEEDYDYHRCQQAIEYLTRLGVSVFPDCEEDEFLELLTRSKVYLSFGMQDSLSISGIQADYLGAHPLYPEMEPYDTFMPKRYLYPPFDFRTIYGRILDVREHPEALASGPRINFDYYSKGSFMDRSRAFLWEKIIPLMS